MTRFIAGAGFAVCVGLVVTGIIGDAAVLASVATAAAVGCLVVAIVGED